MKKINRMFLVLVCAALGVISVAAQHAEIVDEKRPIVANTLFEFPDVEGWSKAEVYIYDDPEISYSVNYDSKEGGRVTVYLYDRGLKSILPGAENDAVINEIEIAKKEIMESVKQGTYKDADVSQWDYVMIGGPDGNVQANRVVLRLWKENGENISEIYLFALHNKFVKIRATRLEKPNGVENIAFTALMKSLDQAFSN